MSILDVNTIDAIGTDKVSGDVILTISDHLDWEDSKFHLIKLQEKLNTYIEFIESEQIFEDYPSSINKIIFIEIISDSDYTEEGILFIKKVNNVLCDIGIGIRQKKLD
jgi:hypothetical protein